MRISQTLDYYIRTTYLSLTRIYNVLLKDFEIQQGDALILISINKTGITVSQLAAELGKQVASLHRQLNRMDNEGLIVRKIDEKDKRVTRIYLTSRGIDARRKIKELVVGLNKEILSVLDKKETEIFFTAFDKLKNQINAEEAKIIKNKKL